MPWQNKGPFQSILTEIQEIWKLRLPGPIGNAGMLGNHLIHAFLINKNLTLLEFFNNFPTFSKK
jgi:hypothetical protein